MSDERQIWLVEHPANQYKEDVKKLARKNDLKIIDAKFAGSIDQEMIAKKPPKLTKIEVEQPQQVGAGDSPEGSNGE